MRSKRKDEHVTLALNQPHLERPFDLMRLKPFSLPTIDVQDVDLKTCYLGHHFDFPFYINAMTGGSAKTLEINRKLATLAMQYKLAIAVGSQHAALDDVSLEASFRIVREVNPDGFIIGNVSANASVMDAQRAIAMIHANALQIHINVAQELAMAEGDRKFKDWLRNIEAIVSHTDIPVIVKAVGNGLDKESVQKLISVGVKHVDVSGRGGTNFVWIEDMRSGGKRYEDLHDWGMTAIESLIDNKDHQSQVEFLASGGVSTPLDVIKLLVLGACGVGLSSFFLKLVSQEKEACLDAFIEDMKHIMVLVNAQEIQDLKQVQYHLDAIPQWRNLCL